MRQTRILENWKEIEKFEEMVQKDTGDPKAGFNASIFWLGEKQLGIPCMYRGKKGKKGEEKFTESYKDVLVFAKYCPFTGKPLFYDVDNNENT
jgi:hypothetical protein